MKEIDLKTQSQRHNVLAGRDAMAAILRPILGVEFGLAGANQLAQLLSLGAEKSADEVLTLTMNLLKQWPYDAEARVQPDKLAELARACVRRWYETLGEASPQGRAPPTG